jgi:5-methylcytosine-specific restriction endonuclease McrA
VKKTALRRKTPLRSRPRVDKELERAKPLLRARSGGFCEVRAWNRCQTLGTQVHHRKRRSQGGAHALSNCLWVCFACHTFIHMAGGKAYDQGWLVRSGDDPAEIPVQVGL